MRDQSDGMYITWRFDFLLSYLSLLLSNSYLLVFLGMEWGSKEWGKREEERAWNSHCHDYSGNGQLQDGREEGGGEFKEREWSR